jgi:hypothetical protein
VQKLRRGERASGIFVKNSDEKMGFGKIRRHANLAPAGLVPLERFSDSYGYGGKAALEGSEILRQDRINTAYGFDSEWLSL